jgi:hypothetical protein
MSSPLVSAALLSWQNQRDYAARLLSDLPPDELTRQPFPGMNHPAWIIGHLSAYPPVLAAILDGRPFEDPLHSRYGRGTMPSGEAAAYPPKAELLREYFDGHDLLARTLAAADEGVLARPIPLARWQDRFPRIGDAVLYLMLSHEAGHLGQLSAWRRAMGKAAV